MRIVQIKYFSLSYELRTDTVWRSRLCHNERIRVIILNQMEDRVEEITLVRIDGIEGYSHAPRYPDAHCKCAYITEGICMYSCLCRYRQGRRQICICFYATVIIYSTNRAVIRLARLYSAMSRDGLTRCIIIIEFRFRARFDGCRPCKHLERGPAKW